MQFKSSTGWTLGVLDHNVDEIPGSQGSSLIIIDSDEIAPSPSVESIEFVESVEELEESVQGPNITILNTVPQEETSLKNNISRFGVQSTIVTKINPEVKILKYY
ncbi:uncharacterized protein LOC129953826 [Eupeodes corollae]|uniref:uncharacterized protein LOC129953826 n=1 Tax=Eupeodes corollae TaxID=290404 RepID=UPI002491F601|nr:uncharacterized protein LOC129953826 [Eupeodes corollae]